MQIRGFGPSCRFVGPIEVAGHGARRLPAAWDRPAGPAAPDGSPPPWFAWTDIKSVDDAKTSTTITMAGSGRICMDDLQVTTS
jgi:hypothetical protein